MIISEFFARLENLSRDLHADISCTVHVISRHHREKVRESGEPYLEHPLDVMSQLIEIDPDDHEAIVAGGLHDLVEDTDISPEVIANHFGDRVIFMVMGCTKKPKELFPNKEARLDDLHQTIITAAQVEYKVIFIRCADRLHNLVTLHGLSHDPEKQLRVAQETLGFYIPLLENDARLWVPEKFHPVLDQYAHRMRHHAMAYLPTNSSLTL